jgi:hypothetical protein
VWGGLVRTLLGSAHRPQPLSPVKPGLGPSIQRVTAAMAEPPSCRFPPPWRVVEKGSCFLVKDDTGRTMGWFCFRDHPRPRSRVRVMTRDEARRMAVNFAMLPEPLGKVGPDERSS